jgi:hypothetical protein
LKFNSVDSADGGHTVSKGEDRMSVDEVVKIVVEKMKSGGICEHTMRTPTMMVAKKGPLKLGSSFMRLE